MKYHIKHGNALEQLKNIPSNFCRCCVTSPPYWGQRNYDVDGQIGIEPTPQEYVKHLTDVFKEIKRVLTHDGTLWLNLGDSYVSAPTGSRGKCTGAEYGFGKNHKHANAASKRRDKRLKDLPEKNLIGVPWRAAFSLQDDGWILRQDIIWQKKNPLPSSVKDRFTSSHEYLFLLSVQPKYYFNHEEAMEAASYDGRKETKGTIKYKNNDNIVEAERWPTEVDGIKMRNMRDVWDIAVASFKGSHCAVMPTELAERCIQIGSEEGDWVLDPFSGVATTGAAALRYDRNYLGIELNKEYIDLSKNRLNKIDPMFVEEIKNIGD